MKGTEDKIMVQKKVLKKLEKTMDKINSMARIGIKITLKQEKLQRMFYDKIIRALKAEVFRENPKEFLKKLHTKIIPFKMIILSKMYDRKTFEEVEMDVNVDQLKSLIEGPNIVKQIK